MHKGIIFLIEEGIKLAPKTSNAQSKQELSLHVDNYCFVNRRQYEGALALWIEGKPEAFCLLRLRHVYGSFPCETKASMKRHMCASDKLRGLLPSGSFVN